MPPARAERKSVLMEKFLRGDTETWAKPAPLTPQVEAAPVAPSVEAIQASTAVDTSDLDKEEAPVPAQSNQREDAARELFIENEKLTADKAALEARIAELEAKWADRNAAVTDAPVEAPKKNKGGRPRKVKPEPESAPA